MVKLQPPLLGLYETVISGFIGAWEGAKDRVAAIPAADDEFDWASTASIARVRATHLQHTARMLVSAVMRGDQAAAEWFADSLFKWWGSLQYENRANALYGKTTFITVDALRSEWRELAASLDISSDDERRIGERTAELQRSVLLATLENFWYDIQLVTIELLLSLASQGAAETSNGSSVVEIIVAMLTGKQLRPGDSPLNEMRTMTAEGFFAATVRQFAASGHFRNGYISTLSRFAERVKDMQQPGMVSSRTYSSSSIDDLDSLGEQQLILMAVLSTSRWAPDTALERQLTIWMVHQYESIEILQNLVNSWLQRLGDPADLASGLVTTLLMRTGREGDAATVRENLTDSLTALKQKMETMRGDQLRNAEVDPARLTTLTAYASSTAFTAETGLFPLQLFRAIEDTREALNDSTLNMLQIRKGELTHVEIDRRAVNEDDYWSETMRRRVAAVVLMDVLRACDISDRAAPDAETYWTALKAESERLRESGFSPMLLLENQTKPEWVWQWQHADFGLGYQKPDDLRVWRKDRRGQGYVCNFNEIEVYSVALVPGESILMTREAFEKARFQRFANGAHVETSYSARDDSDFLLDIHLKFSRAVEVGHGAAVRLRYAPEPGQEVNG
jgi:hypothetical protein